MGKKDDIKDKDIQAIIEETEKEAVKDAMQACVEAIEDAGTKGKAKFTAMQKCRKDSASKALGDLGKNVTDAEVAVIVEKGAQEAVNKAMEAAALGFKSETDRKNDAKKALEAALGKPKENITDTEVEKFIRKGAESKVAEVMKACVEEAKNNNQDAKDKDSALRKCRAESAKEALEKSLGGVSVDMTEVNKFVRKSAEEAAVKAVRAKLAAKKADGKGKLSKNEKLDAVKDALKLSLGKDTVTDEEDVTATEVREYQEKMAQQ